MLFEKCFLGYFKVVKSYCQGVISLRGEEMRNTFPFLRKSFLGRTEHWLFLHVTSGSKTKKVCLNISCFPWRIHAKVLSSFTALQYLQGSHLEKQHDLYVHTYILLIAIPRAQQRVELPSWWFLVWHLFPCPSSPCLLPSDTLLARIQNCERSCV